MKDQRFGIADIREVRKYLHALNDRRASVAAAFDPETHDRPAPSGRYFCVKAVSGWSSLGDWPKPPRRALKKCGQFLRIRDMAFHSHR